MASSMKSSAELSLINSLATIHKKSSIPRSRRASSNDEMKTEQLKDVAQGPPRRATVSGPRPNVLPEEDRPFSPPLTRESVGTLPTHSQGCSESADSTPTQNRVSFSHRRDGAIDSSMSSYDVDSSPKTSNTIAKTQRHPRESMNLPPPPPPANRNKDLSSSLNVVPLPFPVERVTSKVKVRPVRRSSVIRIQQLEKMTVPKPRAAAVISPTQPSTKRRKSDADEVQASIYAGARRDYVIGDLARCPSHTVIEHCPRAALSKVSQLKLYDFAFIKRSDGSWTYAILAHRHKGEAENDECMMFVMNEAGWTKTIKKNQWANYIRCVATEDLLEQP